MGDARHSNPTCHSSLTPALPCRPPPVPAFPQMKPNADGTVPYKSAFDCAAKTLAQVRGSWVVVVVVPVPAVEALLWRESGSSFWW
jgi:hypothetical protein